MKTWQKIQHHQSLIDRYLVRERVIDDIRAFFKQQDFHEVETPLLVEHPGTEPYLEVFETQLQLADGRSKKGFLTTSPEYSMKKLLVAGLPKIFQICKSFRNNEGLGGMHNHEFTILEWYRTEADYQEVMKDCEQLLIHLVGGSTLTYQDREYDLTIPWPRISVAEAFERWCGLSTDEFLEVKNLKHKAEELGLSVSAEDTWDNLYSLLMVHVIEPELAKFNQPIFLYDYPLSQAALSKRKVDDPRFAERFEWYVGGIELGNAFSELTDAQEQKQRLVEELQLRKELGKKEYTLDEDFITALETGMPEAGGIAVGVDRLIMLLADVPSVKETLLFPTEDVFEV
ncbi:MAG TPA: EF-P lysine aminoacylase EpmA [Patescibacteria group bacterium]